MKLIELHILQSFPVSCLNRDDVGAPKTAIFGGANRARISSQCLKRAVRMQAREISPADLFQGQRSRLLLERFEKALHEAGVSESEAPEKAKAIAEVFSKLDKKEGSDVTTAVFLSPGEIRQIAEKVATGEEPAKAAKKAQRLDAADIALFGRMVANDASLNVEGAALFSHALSTHKAENDIDFFSAVDDVKAASETAEDAGAGMLGTLEFNSACYYRFCALNLDLLARASHLGGLDLAQRRAVVDAFLRAVIEAVPGARKNSMNAHVRPDFVLGIYKQRGQPVQLVNAFEAPVKANGAGFSKASREALLDHHQQLKKTWGLDNTEELIIPDVPLDEFIEKLVARVV